MKSIFVRKVLLAMLLMLTFNMVIMSVGWTTPVFVITQANSTMTVSLDPPTINGTVIDQEFTVDLKISDAVDISGWQAGLLFNATLLECTGFEEGTFLQNAGPTLWSDQTVDNTLGVIIAHSCFFLGDYRVSGSGQLAYLTFRVKAPGVSDLHLRDVTLVDYYTADETSANIIDVYTVVEVTPPQTVAIESNSTGTAGGVPSGLSDHSFSNETKELSFKITGPHPGFSNVAIPKTLLSVDDLDDWTVIIDGAPLSATKTTVTENTTHYSIYFTYDEGTHNVDITARELLSSTISITLSSSSVTVGSDVTISGTIDPVRPGVTVTIESRSTGGTWSTLATITTDSNSNYSHTWTPQTAGTYEIRAGWDGDAETEGDVSDVKTLTVKGAAGIDPIMLAAIAVVIILVIAVVVYFVKIRKPEEE